MLPRENYYYYYCSLLKERLQWHCHISGTLQGHWTKLN